jgi:hypothetical protein
MILEPPSDETLRIKAEVRIFCPHHPEILSENVSL